MRVGIPREVKDQEHRVAITPAGVHALVRRGHEVVIERDAGIGSAITDEEYSSAGARVGKNAEEVWETSALIVKVKEPTLSEYPMMRAGQMLFAYLHLAADKALTTQLLDRKVTALAYETVASADGSLPLLAPMSEVAGRLATQLGAHTMLRTSGGSGLLLGGVPGTRPATVVILGAGVSGRNAAAVAIGMGADTWLFDTNLARLRHMDELYGGRCHTLASTTYDIEEKVRDADLVIGAVLVSGAKAPTLISNALVKRMRPGSVLVDIAIDQGGCFEDSRPTTHSQPTFRVHESVFYCVANMPGVVPQTSTFALTNATLPYVIDLANRGWVEACRADASLANGLAAHDGQLTSEPVAQAHGLDYVARAL